MSERDDVPPEVLDDPESRAVFEVLRGGTGGEPSATDDLEASAAPAPPAAPRPAADGGPQDDGLAPRFEGP